jgi:outer membrane protein assembly factor BamB
MRAIRPFRRHASLSFLSFLVGQFFALFLSSCGYVHPDYCTIASPNRESIMVSADGLLYMAAPDAGTLYALRTSDGSVQWKYHDPQWQVALLPTSPLVVDSGIVYLRTRKSLVALRSSDGHVLWSYNQAQNVLFRVDHESVYIYSGAAPFYITDLSHRTLVALDSNNGIQRWRTGISVLSTGYSSLQVANGVVYLFYAQGQVIALREDTGKQIWNVHLEVLPAASSPPQSIIHQGIVYVVTNQLYALRASDGKLLWQDPGAVVGSKFALDVEHESILDLHVKVNGSVVYALRATNGRLLWHAPSSLSDQVALLNGTFYLGISSGFDDIENWLDFQGRVTAMRPGAQKPDWSYGNTHDATTLTVVSSGSATYILSHTPSGTNATLVELQTRNGKVLRRISLQAGGLSIADGSLYAGYAGNTGNDCYPAANSHVEKLRANNLTQLWRSQLK